MRDFLDNFLQKNIDMYNHMRISLRFFLHIVNRKSKIKSYAIFFQLLEKFCFYPDLMYVLKYNLSLKRNSDFVSKGLLPHFSVKS